MNDSEITMVSLLPLYSQQHTHLTYDWPRQQGHSTAVPRARVRAAPSAHAVATSSCRQAAWNRWSHASAGEASSRFSRQIGHGGGGADGLSADDVLGARARLGMARGRGTAVLCPLCREQSYVQ